MSTPPEQIEGTGGPDMGSPVGVPAPPPIPRGAARCRLQQKSIAPLARTVGPYHLIERLMLALLRLPRLQRSVPRRADDWTSQWHAPARAQPSMRSTLIGASFLSFQPLLLNILSVPVTAYIVHRLGPVGYGQWMTAVSLVAVCAILTSLGLRGAFIRSVAADPPTAASALAEQLGLRLLLSALACALATSGCLLLGYPTSVLWCTAIGGAGLVLITVSTTVSDVLQALERMKIVAGVNMISGVVLISASLLAALHGADPIVMAAAYLSGPLCGAALLTVIVSRQHFPMRIRFSLVRFSEILVRCRFFGAQQFLSSVSTQAEALLLPRLVGMSQFGLFTAGTLVATRLTVVPDGLCTAAYPAMVRAYARSRAEGAKLLARYLLIASGGGILLALGGMMIADPIARLLFPPDPALLATVVRVSVWSLPIVAIELAMSYALNAAGDDAAQARASVPAALVSLVATVSLVLALGVMGACWSMLLRPAIRAAFLAPLTLRNLKGASAVEEMVADEGRSNIALLSRTYRKAG